MNISGKDMVKSCLIIHWKKLRNLAVEQYALNNCASHSRYFSDELVERNIKEGAEQEQAVDIGTALAGLSVGNLSLIHILSPSSARAVSAPGVAVLFNGFLTGAGQRAQRRRAREPR